MFISYLLTPPPSPSISLPLSLMLKPTTGLSRVPIQKSYWSLENLTQTENVYASIPRPFTPQQLPWGGTNTTELYTPIPFFSVFAGKVKCTHNTMQVVWESCPKKISWPQKRKKSIGKSCQFKSGKLLVEKTNISCQPKQKSPICEFHTRYL